MINKKGDVMAESEAADILYTENIPYKLEQTARIGYLLGKNYYKNYVNTILDLDEYAILSHITANPHLSQSDLSKLMYKGKAHIGKILRSMEKKGYVKRGVATSNNIMKKVTKITAKGEKLLYETHRVFVKLAQNVLSVFTPEEKEIFIKLLDKYRDKITSTYEIIF